MLPRPDATLILCLGISCYPLGVYGRSQGWQPLWNQMERMALSIYPEDGGHQGNIVSFYFLSEL